VIEECCAQPTGGRFDLVLGREQRPCQMCSVRGDIEKMKA